MRIEGRGPGIEGYRKEFRFCSEYNGKLLSREMMWSYLFLEKIINTAVTMAGWKKQTPLGS